MKISNFFVAIVMFLTAHAAEAATFKYSELNAVEQAVAAQILLKRGGYDVGVDGQFGGKSYQALNEFRASINVMNRIGVLVSATDIRSLAKKFGAVERSEIHAAVPDSVSTCADFPAGTRVVYTRPKTKSDRYGTAVFAVDEDTMLVDYDGVRGHSSNTIKTFRARRAKIACSKLSKTKH